MDRQEVTLWLLPHVYCTTTSRGREADHYMACGALSTLRTHKTLFYTRKVAADTMALS
jgi:hypothetical protein